METISLRESQYTRIGLGQKICEKITDAIQNQKNTHVAYSIFRTLLFFHSLAPEHTPSSFKKLEIEVEQPTHTQVETIIKFKKQKQVV